MGGSHRPRGNNPTDRPKLTSEGVVVCILDLDVVGAGDSVLVEDVVFGATIAVSKVRGVAPLVRVEAVFKIGTE